MTAQVQEILLSFERLDDEEKRELVSELLRRSPAINALPLSDEQLVSIAEELFLQLDRDEASHA
jgi:hypothetical protein